MYKNSSLTTLLNPAQTTILVRKTIRTLDLPVLTADTGRSIEQRSRIIHLLQLIQTSIVRSVEGLLEVGLLDIRLGHVCARVGASSTPLAEDGVGEVIHLLEDLGVGSVGVPAGGANSVHEGVAEGRVSRVGGVSVDELGLHVEGEEGVAVGDGGAEGFEGGIEQRVALPVHAGEEAGAGHHHGGSDGLEGETGGPGIVEVIVVGRVGGKGDAQGLELVVPGLDEGVVLGQSVVDGEKGVHEEHERVGAGAQNPEVGVSTSIGVGGEALHVGADTGPEGIGRHVGASGEAEGTHGHADLGVDAGNDRGDNTKSTLMRKWLDTRPTVIEENQLTTTATTNSPEEIGVARLGHGDKATVGKDNLQGENLISGQAVDTGQRRVATTENITTSNTDGL